MNITRNSLNRISDYIWEIPRTFRKNMKVAARIFASEKLLNTATSDRSLEQLVNVASLPGIQGQALVMPDVHEGYGFPIGGVAAMDIESGVISPGGIGYDINCGVRLLLSNIVFNEFQPEINQIADEFNKNVPSGVGVGGEIKLDLKMLLEILDRGIEWAESQGFALREDANHIESSGRLENADSENVSEHARLRGKNQLGTMGAGNHFVEVDAIAEIFDAKIAQIFGLAKNQMVVLIHCGSRGLGHQVATDYIRLMMKNLDKYNIVLPDPELACAPFSSSEGKRYFGAMKAAANFAFVNRQLITHEIRLVWQSIFGKDENLKLLYDVSHNIAKVEDHEVNGKRQKVVVHRKGATRSFGPENEELPADYRAVGQPVIIPGSMGSSSYVLVGTNTAMKLSFGSTCHGAGRRMSRHQAKKSIGGKTLISQLAKEGIVVRSGSIAGVSEEAPTAYKEIDEVIRVVDSVGIAKKVARLKPVVVVKG